MGAGVTHGVDAIAATVGSLVVGGAETGAGAWAAYKMTRPGSSTGDTQKPPEPGEPYKPASGFNQYGGQSTETLVDNAVNTSVTAGEPAYEQSMANALPKTPVKTIDDIVDFAKDTGLPDA